MRAHRTEAEQPLLVIADLYSEEDVARLVVTIINKSVISTFWLIMLE